MKKRVGTIFIFVLILLFGWLGYDYLHYREVNAVSDAAFIKSDRLATLSFKVNGKVITMAKEPNIPVKKGELLARIDPKDFLTRKKELTQKIAALKESIEALTIKKERIADVLRLKVKMAGVDIDAIERRREALAFRIDAAKARLKKLQKDTARYRRMLKKRLIARGDYEEIVTERNALRDDIAAMQKELAALGAQKRKTLDARAIAEAETKQAKELAKQIAAKTRLLKANEAALRLVNLQIGYTRLYAPFDGIIAKKFFDAPKVVQAGYPVYALTDPKKLYCEVLLSEKKLHGVHPGNPVKITVDAVKGKTYRGHVESIAPTSASTFSLVPRDIASGEFTKLDQRFVVRIKLDEIEGLRAGMGATVAIARESGH